MSIPLSRKRPVADYAPPPRYGVPHPRGLPVRKHYQVRRTIKPQRPSSDVWPGNLVLFAITTYLIGAILKTCIVCHDPAQEYMCTWHQPVLELLGLSTTCSPFPEFPQDLFATRHLSRFMVDVVPRLKPVPQAMFDIRNDNTEISPGLSSHHDILFAELGGQMLELEKSIDVVSDDVLVEAQKFKKDADSLTRNLAWDMERVVDSADKVSSRIEIRSKTMEFTSQLVVSALPFLDQAGPMLRLTSEIIGELDHEIRALDKLLDSAKEHISNSSVIEQDVRMLGIHTATEQERNKAHCAKLYAISRPYRYQLHATDMYVRFSNSTKASLKRIQGVGETLDVVVKQTISALSHVKQSHDALMHIGQVSRFRWDADVLHRRRKAILGYHDLATAFKRLREETKIERVELCKTEGMYSSGIRQPRYLG